MLGVNKTPKRVTKELSLEVNIKSIRGRSSDEIKGLYLRSTEKQALVNNERTNSMGRREFSLRSNETK